MGYTIYGKVDTLEEFEELQKRHSKPDIKDVMIKASKKPILQKINWQMCFGKVVWLVFIILEWNICMSTKIKKEIIELRKLLKS